MEPIDIKPYDLKAVLNILARHVPKMEVRVFGSRITWTAKEFSDLDLVFMDNKPLPFSTLADLEEAFSESDLPFKVDVVDWATTKESFRRIIEQKYVVVQEKEKKAIESKLTKHTLNEFVKIIEAFRFRLPPISEQQAIAHVLCTLDDKIELNRQVNETLEAMAQAIFKSWFVDFDPVYAKAKGQQPVGMPPEIAELFPDSFEDSDLGQIPTGWAIVNVGEAVEFAYGKALKADNRKPGIIPVFGSNGQVGWHNQALVEGPGIVIGRKGNPGIITWADSDFFPIDTAFYVVPKRKELSLHYLFHALSYLNLFDLSSDSAVPGLNRNLVYISKILIPNIAIMSPYNNIALSLSLEIKNNDEESLALVDIRNILLPKLISGDVNMKKTEKLLC